MKTIASCFDVEETARYYLDAPEYFPSENVKRGFREFVQKLARVKTQGIRVQYVDYEPYFQSGKLCLDNVRADLAGGNLLISKLFNDSDLLGPDANLQYRAVHEIHHVELKVGFNWLGECAIADHHMSLTDNLLFRQLIFSEVVGQVAAFFYNRGFPPIEPGKKQKLVLYDLARLCP